MTATVFVGPTLDASRVAAELPNARIHPPAQAGDLYRAVAHGTTVVVLIDGVFGTVPSVWHKEILFALDRGCRVFGAASMGALRAAECRTFGMVGVGEIYRMYADGTLEDDDEVAVSHLGPESAYEQLSVPMVNLRHAAQRAIDAGIVAQADVEPFLVAAKAVFYPDRTWEFLAELAAGGLEEFVAFAQDESNDLKAKDAVESLVRVGAMTREDENGSPSSPSPDFTFEATAFWERLRGEVDVPHVTPWFADPPTNGRPAAADKVDVVRRILLRPDDPALGLDARLWVHLVQLVARTLGVTPSRAEVQQRSEDVRRAEGLLDAAATRRWLDERGLGIAEWHRALAFELTVERLRAEFAADLRDQVPLLVARHGGWNQHLVRQPDDTVSQEMSSSEETELVRRVASRPGMPWATDMETFAARLGFSSLSEMLAVLRTAERQRQ